MCFDEKRFLFGQLNLISAGCMQEQVSKTHLDSGVDVQLWLLNHDDARIFLQTGYDNRYHSRNSNSNICRRNDDILGKVP